MVDRCRQGHELLPDNLYIRKSGKLSGNRQCKACAKARALGNKLNKDSELEKERLRAYYIRNKEKVVIRSKQWAINNPEKHKEHCRAQSHKRRVLSEVSPFPTKEWKELLSKVDGFCIFCAKHVPKLTIGHALPVSKGGLNNIENLIPQCMPCNLSQAARPLEEWFEEKIISEGNVRINTRQCRELP